MRPIRLHDYDYTSSGSYFVTVCTARRRQLFASAADGQLVTTPAGELVRRVWLELPQHFDGVGLATIVVMPDHVHGILILDQSAKERPTSLSTVMGSFKSAGTKLIHRYCGITGTVWQRSFHERVLRSESEFRRIQRYIEQNPERL